MRQNKPFQVLCGSLLLGIAAASAFWLFAMPRDRGISDSQARAMHFPDANTYNRVDMLTKSISVHKRLKPNEVFEASALLKIPSVGTQVDTLFALSKLATVSGEKDKALDLMLPFVNNPDPDLRGSAAILLKSFNTPRADQAYETLLNDPDEEVRRHAKRSVAMRVAWRKMERDKN